MIAILLINLWKPKKFQFHLEVLLLRFLFMGKIHLSNHCKEWNLSAEAQYNNWKKKKKKVALINIFSSPGITRSSQKMAQSCWTHHTQNPGETAHQLKFYLFIGFCFCLEWRAMKLWSTICNTADDGGFKWKHRDGWD